MKNFLHKYIVIVLAFVAVALDAHSQEETQLPAVISPSPETAALFRFTDYAVNTSTGVPEISIPIFEVKSGSLSVPISISYNASGRQVLGETGPIGIGWSLNTGGMVSRTVYDKPDEVWDFPSSSDFLTAHELSLLDDRERYQRLSSFYKHATDENTFSSYDTEYDVFSYFFGSSSGRFVLNRYYDATLLPLKPYEINVDSDFSRISITDDKGTGYSFGGSFFETPKTSGFLFNYRTGWYLSQITSADEKDTISFNYKLLEEKYISKTEEYIIVDQARNMTPPYLNGYPVKDVGGEYKLCRITEISFGGGKVVFNLDAETDKVNSIQVKKAKGEVLKTIEFHRSYLDFPIDATLGKEKLDEVVFKDKNGKVIEKYSLEYYPTKSEGSTSDDQYNLANRDWWGYRNGSVQTHLLPDYHNILIYYLGGTSYETYGSGANRTPSASYAKRGVLKKITYPTGGSTEFSYEGNRYIEYGSVKDGPGLRVSQIKSTDNAGNVLLKTYKYGVDECGYGTLPYTYGEKPISSQSLFLNINMGYDDGDFTKPGVIEEGYRKRKLTSSFNSEISYLTSQPVTYSQVTEYVGTAMNNVGKTVYRYSGGNTATISSFPDPLLRVGGELLTYDNKNFTYDNKNFTYDDMMLKLYVTMYKFWDKSVLSSREDYQNTGLVDDTGKPLYIRKKTVLYDYESITTDTIRGLNVYQYLEFPNLRDEKNAGELMGLPIYGYADYFIAVGKKNLVSTTEVNYDDSGQVARSTEYSYNDRHLVSETRQRMSSGEMLVTEKKYPFDLALDAVHQTMVNRNMLNYVVEQNEYVMEENGYKDANTLQSVKTDYRDWGNNVIAPEVVSTRQGTDAFEPRLTYNAYDERGRVASVSREGDVPISYVWGYNYQYPIAKVKNATRAEVETALGGASAVEALSGSAFLSQDQLDQLNGLRTKLPDAMVTTYTYNPLVGMASSTDANGLTTSYDYDNFGRLEMVLDQDKNILSHRAYKMQNPSYFSAAKSGTFTKNDCGPDYVGSEEIYMVPTGTYTSAVSQSDADAKAQRDVDTKGQAYANREGHCFVYSNREQEGTFTKNDCGAGYLGSEETYTVPAGTYTSTISWADADAQALEDVQANGQAYANANGTCRAEMVYESVAMSETFTKACPFGYTGNQVIYTVAAGKYTSTYSQADADAQAQYDLDNYGQGYANDNGYCTENAEVSVQVLNNSYYDAIVTYSNSSGSASYSAPNGVTTTIAVPTGIYTLQIELPGNTLYTYTFQISGSSKTGKAATFQNVEPGYIRIY